MLSPDNLIQRLLDLGVVSEGDFQPCFASDITMLESGLHVTLPEAYKVFLRRMGRGAGQFLTSDHWAAYYENLLPLNTDLRKDLN
jgi:hypothetical protein